VIIQTLYVGFRLSCAQVRRVLRLASILDKASPKEGPWTVEDVLRYYGSKWSAELDWRTKKGVSCVG